MTDAGCDAKVNTLREANKLAQRRRRLRPGVLERERIAMAAKRAGNAEYVLRERTLNRKRGLTKAGRLEWLVSNARYRANKFGIEFDITAVDLEIPDTCPVLGIAITLGLNGKNKRNPNSPSIDRFDNSKGYVRGNVRVISLRANVLKSDATTDEIRRVLQYMEGRL